MRTRTRALFNLSGAARQCRQAADNLLEHAQPSTLARLAEIAKELDSIEERERAALNNDRRPT